MSITSAAAKSASPGSAPFRSARSPLAAAILLALCAAAHAETPADAGAGADELDNVEVIGHSTRKVASPKYTEALVDTPQTITIVTKAVIDQQNLLGLREVLSTLPGITFGAGEGGGGYGDSINLRGFSASADITTDGVRDSAQYTRSDTFNLEAIELVNGANSAVSGAGSVGGNINLVSKTARPGEAHAFTAGAGTDGYGRITADSNFDFDNGMAVRLNAMAHRNDVPGRDVEDLERWGVAPSVAFGLGGPTRFTLAYFHQHDENVPEYGVPYYAAFGGGLPGVGNEVYLGYRNMDRQDIDVDMVTGVFEQDFGDDVTLRSLARYQVVDQVSVVNPPQGTFCLASGINPATGAACAAPGTYQPSGPRGNLRDTENTIAISQTDLTARFATGAVEHALVAGASFSRERFELDTGNVQRNADGTLPVLPPMTLADPDNVYAGPINYIRSGVTEGTLDNRALYAFDTIKFGERWALSLGARYERNEGDTVAYTFSTTGANLGAVTARTAFANEEDLFSWRAGVVFKPTEAGTIYLSYADSKTPSKASVNGACTAATCNVDPETAANLELGAKWEVFDRRLLLSAAVFRNERENYKVVEPVNIDNPNGEQQLDGRARVDGVSVGVTGRITDAWSVFANATYLDSEVLRGVSDFCLDNPSTTCGNTAADPDPLRGLAISATPERSGSVWSTYALRDWTFGYGLTYQSAYDVYTGTGANIAEAKGHTVHRAMVGYRVNDRLGLQLNANNLFDKDYFVRVRNNGWATPGEARQVVLSATYRF